MLRAKKLLRGRHPSLAEFMQAVARLGGHIKSNGPPGYLVLWRGMRALDALAEGWRLGKM